MFIYKPTITLLSRPVFSEPAHLPVHWMGDATDGERLAEFAGRLCYMSQKNPASRETRAYLENIKKQGHGSVLEHANYSVLFEGVSRSLTHELIRHRAGWAYCLAGDTLIYSERFAGGLRDGAKKRTIRQIYEMTSTPHGRSRLKLMKLRCLDQASGTFTAGRIASVARAGVKPVFRVELEDGKAITCSREHRFLTKTGWRALEDIVGGVEVSLRGSAVTGALGQQIFVNGIPAYRDAAWLKRHYHDMNLDQRSMAELAGVSSHCIRAWIRRHGLQKPTGTGMTGRTPWNKGRCYQGGWHHSPETRKALGDQKRGSRNPAWRGGTTPYGVAVRKGARAVRPEILARDDHTCRLCGVRGGKLTIHHILPIWARPDLAMDKSNLACVCRSCHLKMNGRELEYVTQLGRSPTEIPSGTVRKISGGQLLAPVARRIVRVTYAGEQETFDLEMAGEHHNFVANGIVTHNSQLSQRYVDETEANFVVPPAIIGDEALEGAWRAQIEAAQASYVALVAQLMERYAWVEDRVHRRKMAREAARGVLPNSTETKIVATANARAWRTMLELRAGEGAEQEIRRMAVTVLRLLQAEAPAFFSDFEIYSASDRQEAAKVGYHKV